jgi:hypothetical protein
MMTEAEVRAELPLRGWIDSSFLGRRLAVLAFARRDVELYALPIGSGARALGRFFICEIARA